LIHRAFTVILISAVLCGLIAPAVLGGGPDIRSYYTSTLAELGVTYGYMGRGYAGRPIRQ